MCVKPAALTTHSPPKVFAYPPAQRHALPEHFRSPTQPRRTPAGCAMPSPPTSQPIPRRSSPLAPSIFSRPSRALLITHAAPTHAPEHFRSPAPRRCIPRRPHNPFPAEALRSPPHSDTPFPSTSAPPRSPDARPQAARCTPADLTTHSPPKPVARPAQRHALPEHFLTPTQQRRTPAGCAMHSSPKAFAPPPPFHFGHKKNGTAQWMCDAECLGRPSLRSVIWVGGPRAVRRRCGALRVGVGLRPQPWALRSRRCGRVLRA